MRRIDETPKRHILGRNRVDWCITCGRRAFGVGCAFAQQVTGKKERKLREPYISPIWGAETPADHYELWPTCLSRRRNDLFKFLY
jgi:hypothetical protein